LILYIFRYLAGDASDSDSGDESGDDDDDEPEESLNEMDGSTGEGEDDAEYESKVKHMRTVYTTVPSFKRK